MSILIVDDDVEYLHYVSVVVETEGHKPVSAYSGEAARKEIERQKFSLVLMDLALPDMPGVELIADACKADPLTVCIPMTAFATVASALEAIRYGAYDYLLKPTGMDAITSTVRRGLEYYKLRKTLIERTAQMEKFKRESHEAAALINEVCSGLRNPLSVVYGFSSLLAEDEMKISDPQEMRRAVDFILKNAESMRRVLDGLANPPERVSPKSPAA